METLNLHMKNVHQETDSERIDRVADTVKLALKQELIKSNTKPNKPSFDCTECGIIFKDNHNQKIHASGRIPKVIVEKKQEETIQIVCELCEKVFLNRVQKSNHKLLVHTVREENIKCDFCHEVRIGLTEICKHISNTHSELFSKKPDKTNQCNMCYTQFENEDK